MPIRLIFLSLSLVALAACAPRPAHVAHHLPPTGGAVRFATSREAFYQGRHVRQVTATAPRICAGFVHPRKFGHYLRYGAFRLEMTHEVFLGGQAAPSGDWVDGRLLRTLRKDIAIKAGADSYVWCGRLRGGGQWKVGAMRWQFHLRGPERSMDEPVARGTLVVAP